MRIGLLASILLATAMVLGACWLWSGSHPSPGQRYFEPTRIWGMRCLALAMWCAAHAVLTGWSLPMIYRARPALSALAICCGGMGVLNGVVAAGLLLANM